MKKEILHVYYSSSKFGGIESYILGLQKFSKFLSVKLNILEYSNFKFINYFYYIEKFNFKNRINHFHGILPPITLTILLSTSKKKIWTPHFHPPKETKRPLLSYLNLLFSKILIGNQKLLIICQSNHEKNYLKNFFKNSKFFTIPTGHYFTRKIEYKKIYDCIYIARNDQIKNINFFVQLSKKIKSRKFCLITDKYIEQKPSNLDVYNHISDEKKFELLRSSKVFINTSKYEAFGISMAEAESQGLVILSDNKSQYFNLDPNYKLYYKTNDTKGIHKQINEILKDKKKYKKLSDIAYTRSKKYSLNSMVKHFDQIYS